MTIIYKYPLTAITVGHGHTFTQSPELIPTILNIVLWNSVGEE